VPCRRRRKKQVAVQADLEALTLRHNLQSIRATELQRHLFCRAEPPGPLMQNFTCWLPGSIAARSESVPSSEAQKVSEAAPLCTVIVPAYLKSDSDSERMK
jgi:hypothetical protein